VAIEFNAINLVQFNWISVVRNAGVYVSQSSLFTLAAAQLYLQGGSSKWPILINKKYIAHSSMIINIKML
jgi:hypothetical protein